MVDSAVRAADREDRRGDQADLRRPDPLPRQHARARRSHRRQREFRQAGRRDHVARRSCAPGSRSRLRRERRARPPAAGGAAAVTYDAPITFHMNGEARAADPGPARRTPTATRWCSSPNADVIMTGDFFRSARLPEHRPRQRRHAEGHDRRLERGHRRSPGRRRRSSPATAPIVDRTAVAAHRDMLIGVATRWRRWCSKARRWSR